MRVAGLHQHYVWVYFRRAISTDGRGTPSTKNRYLRLGYGELANFGRRESPSLPVPQTAARIRGPRREAIVALVRELQTKRNRPGRQEITVTLAGIMIVAP